MKLSEIITRVQRQFGDDVQAQITKEDIVRWVNDACLEIVNANSTNRGYNVGAMPVTAGRREYDLPPDLLLLRAVKVNGMKVEASTFDQIDAIDSQMDATTGTPTHYWVYGNKLNLYPVPSDSLGDLSVMYVKTPDVLTVDMLDRVPDVPTQYHPRIVEYCIAQAAELDDNLAHYQSKMNQFQSNLQSLQSNSQNPESDSFYPSITYLGE